MSLYEVLTLVSVWCGGNNSAPQNVKDICKEELMSCLILNDIGLNRDMVVGCFRKTKIV